MDLVDIKKCFMVTYVGLSQFLLSRVSFNTSFDSSHIHGIFIGCCEQCACTNAIDVTPVAPCRHCSNPRIL
jgi:hypothetical protein